MKPEIPVYEPFKKTFSEPQIIITREDIIEHEKSQTQKRDIENQEPSKSTTEHSSMCRISTDRLMDLRNSPVQSQILRQQQFKTPTKRSDSDYDSVLRSDGSETRTADSDWLLPELSRSRSLPSSPPIGELPNITSYPTMPSNQERYFNFLRDRLRHLDETRLLPESDEVDNGFRLSQEFCHSPHGVKRCCTDLERSPLSLGRTRNRLYWQPEVQVADAQLLRAKRKLDMDDPYSTSVKRAKSELPYDAGLRYVNQLEMDLMSIKHRLQHASPELVNRHTNCACAEMEKHFMEMATGAYKSIRRYDGTMNSFQQFKHELTQTNQVIKDSMELLQNVRRLCVH